MKANKIILYLSVGIILMSAACSSQNSRNTVVEKVVYTCPMHPEVISGKPGTCPKCEMDLVRKEAASDTLKEQPGGNGKATKM